MRLILCAVLGVVGCGTPDPPQGRPDAAATAPEGAIIPGVGATDGYHVTVEAPASATAGQPAIAWVHVQPHAPWHMNIDYPAKLRMHASATVSLDAALLHKSDAERFDDAALVFPVIFTPKADHHGHTTLAGEVYFAVCGAAECAPVQAAVEFSVDVS